MEKTENWRKHHGWQMIPAVTWQENNQCCMLVQLRDCLYNRGTSRGGRGELRGTLVMQVTWLAVGVSGGESAGGTGVTSGGWGQQRWVPSRAGGKKRGLVTDSARRPHGREEPFSHAETEHFVKFEKYETAFLDSKWDTQGGGIFSFLVHLAWSGW